MPATSPLNWISSAVSDFVLAFLPLPTLTLMLSQRTDSTITGAGNGLWSWMTRLAVCSTLGEAPQPGPARPCTNGWRNWDNYASREPRGEVLTTNPHVGQRFLAGKGIALPRSAPLAQAKVPGLRLCFPPRQILDGGAIFVELWGAGCDKTGELLAQSVDHSQLLSG